MHKKQHLADSNVIDRPPTVNVSLPHATVESIDSFIRNVGVANGIRSRSAAIQFLLEAALASYGKARDSADAPVQTPETEGEHDEAAKGDRSGGRSGRAFDTA